jgi:hypothetical protein
MVYDEKIIKQNIEAGFPVEWLLLVVREKKWHLKGTQSCS